MIRATSEFDGPPMTVIRENDIGREELKNQNIQIDVRAEEGKACSIGTRSFWRPEEIFGGHSEQLSDRDL